MLNQKEIQELEQLEIAKKELECRISELKANKTLNFANGIFPRLAWCEKIQLSLRQLALAICNTTINGLGNFINSHNNIKKTSELTSEQIKMSNEMLLEIAPIVTKYMKLSAKAKEEK
jgi:hypothetical protein